MLFENFLLLSAYWIVYFLIHSALANNEIKKRICGKSLILISSYRLIYNILAIILLIPAIYLIHTVPSESLWSWQGYEKWLMNLIALLAMAGFIISWNFYKGMDFSGWQQFRNKTASPVSQFCLSPFHRYVRHPWYTFALLIIWTRDMNWHFLVSASYMTAYLFIGSKLEEKKLVEEFGDVYLEYRSKVPGIIPGLKRRLSKTDANNLYN